MFFFFFLFLFFIFLFASFFFLCLLFVFLFFFFFWSSLFSSPPRSTSFWFLEQKNLCFLILICFFFVFGFFVFVTSCAWNHYIKIVVSGTWARTTPMRAPETTIKTVVSGTAPQNMSWFLICFFFCLCLLLFVCSCARNHYFYSGFRHMSKSQLSACAWNHYKNCGFRHSTKKQISTRAAKKSLNACRNLALRRSTQRRLGKNLVFYTFTPDIPKPLFLKCFRDVTKRHRKKCAFLKTSKKQGQKKKVHFRHIWAHFRKPRNPYFYSVWKAYKNWGSIKLSWNDGNVVQIRSRKHIYIYIQTAQGHDCHASWEMCMRLSLLAA